MTICQCGHEDLVHTIYYTGHPSRRGCKSCPCSEFMPQNNIQKIEKNDYLLFLDYETTGDPDKRLLEVAWMLTDRHLDVLLPCESRVIRQPVVTLPEVVLRMHTRNGLLAEVANTTTEVFDVQQRILETIGPAICSTNRIVLAGFSCHYDRELMLRDMPALNKVLHYRHFDVSVLRSAYHFWVENIPSKKDEHPHRAKDDVLACWEIAKTYMKLYQEHMPKGLIEQGIPI